MNFSQVISGTIFVADAPDVTVTASTASDISVKITAGGAYEWLLTMTPVKVSGGYSAVIRTKEILSSLIEPLGIDEPGNFAEVVTIVADNGDEDAISMRFQALYGSAGGKTPAYMARHWLTWKEQISNTLSGGREMLTFISGLNLLGWKSGAYSVKAKLYTASGSVTVELESSPLTELTAYHNVDASLSTVAAAASKSASAVLAYDVSFSLSGVDSAGAAAALESYPLRFVVAVDDPRLKEFVFVNSFGVEDRVISCGATQDSLSGGGSTFVTRGSEREISNDAKAQWEVQSGRIASGRAAELWSEFLRSAQRYYAAQSCIRLIVVDEFDTDVTEGELSGVSFKYHLGTPDEGSWYEDDESIGEYDPVQKYGALVVGDLPDAADPPSEDLFFLKTRLDEFPLVSLSENYLFLVQSPISYHWGAASLESLKSYLEGAIHVDIPDNVAFFITFDINRETLPDGSYRMEVSHNMGRRPAVTVTDADGNAVFLDVRHADDNTAVLAWSGDPLAGGKVYLV